MSGLTFAGLKVVIDPKLPADVVLLRDPKTKLCLARIVNVGKASPMTNGNDEDAVLERWADIQDDPDAIVKCGERWKLIAAAIGCQLHGFNDGRSASFTTPDGHTIEVGPKFRAFIASRLARPDNWQPIENAPKDKHVLIHSQLWGVSEGMFYSHANDGKGRWHISAFNGQVLTAEPTCWQPLPAPPQVEALSQQTGGSRG